MERQIIKYTITILIISLILTGCDKQNKQNNSQDLIFHPLKVRNIVDLDNMKLARVNNKLSRDLWENMKLKLFLDTRSNDYLTQKDNKYYYVFSKNSIDDYLFADLDKDSKKDFIYTTLSTTGIPTSGMLFAFNSSDYSLEEICGSQLNTNLEISKSNDTSIKLLIVRSKKIQYEKGEFKLAKDRVKVKFVYL